MRSNTIYSLLVCTLLSLSCSGTHQPTLEYDFLETCDFIPPECAADTIEALQESLRFEPQDPEIHRRLSVCYRAIGTPESRLLSMQEIDEALRLDPDNPTYLVERGLTLYARRFARAALGSLNEALDIDPGYFHAWYHMGRIEKDIYLENMCFENHLTMAIKYFTRANNLDGKHEETLFDLGLLQYLRGRMDLCAEYARTGSKYHPSSFRFRLLSAAAALERTKFTEASEEFEKALSLMNMEIRDCYEDISLLIPVNEVDRYLNLDESNRRDFERRFWVSNDPTPATAMNERRLEHYLRIFLVRELLTDARLGLEGAETARGRALVSYGLPQTMLFSIGSGVDGPSVTWNYIHDGRMFLLFFMNEFLNGNYHIPIDSRFSSKAMMTEGILQSVQQMYTFPVDFRPIPVYVRNVQFRVGSEMTRVEFSAGIPDSIFDSRNNDYEMDFTLFDHDWNLFLTEKRYFDPDTITVHSGHSGKMRILTFHMDLPALQLESSFALEIIGGHPKGWAIHREPLAIRDLSGGSLRVSGIKLSLLGKGDNCLKILDPAPAYEIGSHLCVYYEIYNLRRNGENMSRYKVTYTVSSLHIPENALEGSSGIWEWIKASATGTRPEPQIFISSSIEQSINAASTSDALRIDSSALEPGRFLLTLEVEDLVANTAVSEEVSFTVNPRKGS